MKIATLALVAACVPSQRELRAPVDAELDRRIGARATAAVVDELLARPLDADAAVRVALANSPRLAAALDELGVAGGELAAALALGPTDVELRLRFGTPSANHEHEVDVVQSVLGLVTAPRRRAAAHAELAAARARAIATALRLAARVEIAFHDLLAAEREVELRRTAFDAADAAALLRERMFAAGNTTELARARDRAAREEARVALARAEAAVEAHRERVAALLGLSGARTAWTTSGALAELPADPPQLDDLEAAAITASVDLAGARASSTAAANRLGAENVRAWLPELAAGIAILDVNGTTEVGPAVRVGVPLFDQRRGERAKARAALARADHELAAVAIELRAGARAARIAALAAYDEARHLRDIVVPLHQQIVDELVLHYNAMDADPFQLVVARRELADAAHHYLDALRRYWNATSEVTALRRGVSLEGP